MTFASPKRRQLITAIALIPFGNVAFAQDKTSEAKPAACNPT